MEGHGTDAVIYIRVSRGQRQPQEAVLGPFNFYFHPTSGAFHRVDREAPRLQQIGLEAL